MAGPEFWQTVMGHRFFEGQLPRLIKALERLADVLEKAATPLVKVDMTDDGKKGKE